MWKAEWRILCNISPIFFKSSENVEFYFAGTMMSLLVTLGWGRGNHSLDKQPSHREKVLHIDKRVNFDLCVFFGCSFLCKFTLFINAYLLLENICWWNAVIFPEYLPLNLKEPCDFQHSPSYVFYINCLVSIVQRPYLEIGLLFEGCFMSQ